MGTTGIRIIKPDLDMDDRGIIVTGYVDPTSLGLLKVDSYQREELSQVKISDLMEALRNSRVPTIELGMRGDENAVSMDDEVYLLQAPTYIVDGFQRVTAALRLYELDPTSSPRIQVTVHLNTSFEWERKRFEVLNIAQTKVNGNVMLRNLQYDFEVINTLYKLSQSRTFVLGGQISWNQNQRRSDLITGVTFVKTVGMLHSHIGPGRSTKVQQLASGMQKTMENTGKIIMTQNVKTFFDLINECWGIETVVYRSGATQLRSGFLLALARMLSDHDVFWKNTRLFIDVQAKRKLASFPMRDPEVQSMSSGGGVATDHLAILLADHINKGRRTNKLVRRTYADEVEFGDEFNIDEGE